MEGRLLPPPTRRSLRRPAVKLRLRDYLPRATRAVVSALAALTLVLVAAIIPVQAAILPKAGATPTSIVETREATDSQQLAIGDAVEAPAVEARDDFTSISRAETLRLQFAGVYSVSWSGSVRWPFPGAAPMSSDFGWRPAPCDGCSSDHRGIDLNPGDGTPIYAIADGTVSLQQEEGGGYGNHVYIDHVINGQRVRSLYAHMQPASSPLRTGDAVKVGDFVGLVGATGMVTGPHLHLEIDIDGQAIDPFVWLTENAS